jgi:hypothetical protein
LLDVTKNNNYIRLTFILAMEVQLGARAALAPYEWGRGVSDILPLGAFSFHVTFFVKFS